MPATVEVRRFRLRSELVFGGLVRHLPEASRHLPGQHRQDDHAGGGGGGVRNALDKLRLAGRIQLDDGEELMSSGKLDFDSGSVRVAVTRRNGRPSMRLALVAYADEMPKWSGNEPRSAALEAERERIEAEQEQFDEDDPLYDELTIRLRELGEGDDWATARLDGAAVEQLRTTLHAAADEGARLENEENDRWDEIDRLETQIKKLYDWSGNNYDELVAAAGNPERENALQAERDRNFARINELEAAVEQLRTESEAVQSRLEHGYVIAEGEIPGEWGDVTYQVEFDDLTASARVAVRPHGSDPDWDASIDHPRFDMDELRKVLKLLDAGDVARARVLRLRTETAFTEALLKPTGRGRAAEMSGIVRHLPGEHNQQSHAGDGDGGTGVAELADILDDVVFESAVDGQKVYVGIREDGVIDLGIGTADDDPVGRFSYRDVEKIVDSAYELWRQRTNNGEESDGVVDDRFLQTEHDEIYLAISEKRTYTADPDDPDDEDVFEPVLTVGIPTPDNTDEHPDFYQVDLDEEGLDNLVDNLQALRDDNPPTDVETEGAGPIDVTLTSDHTLQLIEGGVVSDPPTLRVGEAEQLAAAIERLLGVDLPDDPGEEPDTLDGEDINDDLGVSLLTDGSFSVMTPLGYSIEFDRDDAEQFADTLRTLIRRDRAMPGGGTPAAARSARARVARPRSQKGGGNMTEQATRHMPGKHDQSSHGRRGARGAAKAAVKGAAGAVDFAAVEKLAPEPPRPLAEHTTFYTSGARRRLKEGQSPRQVSGWLREARSNHQTRLNDLADELDAAEQSGSSSFNDIETEWSIEKGTVRYLGTLADAIDDVAEQKRRRPRSSAGVERARLLRLKTAQLDLLAQPMEVTR